MDVRVVAALWCPFLFASSVFSLDSPFDDSDALALPEIGEHSLRVISPTILELALVTTKARDPAPVSEWNFVDKSFNLNLPSATEFEVHAGSRSVPIEKIGFKRRVLYAPLKQRDLRIGNWLYVQLRSPIRDGEAVAVANPSGRLWRKETKFTAVADPRGWSPAIHVNQIGYAPAFPKKAMVGYYLGSLGELIVPKSVNQSPPVFKIIDARSGAEKYHGELLARRDQGFTFPTYQQVVEADFSAFNTPGEYRLLVPGLGVSFRFWIDEGVPAAFARTYALGLYHQRCGTNNELPFTRFTHGPCHTGGAEIPTMRFERTQKLIADMSNDFSHERRHTAPQLKDVSSSLYPFVKQGKIDVSGGHHDAGDYSKYTINSAALIHYLVFAVDSLLGVGALDNLGLPESGDGKSDLLQEAKWEADFLAKMQDADGGFYFIVYPKERAYEDDVLPDKGDPQVVWPKTTAATAAAVAALAQTASSPLFKKQFPEAARIYLDKAKKGWAFLERAMAKHGRDGSYQKISHYGHEFLHDDELAWATTELFLATGDHRFERELISRFDPNDRDTKRWTWWRLYEAYGCVIRSYAFGAKSGRVQSGDLDSAFLQKSQNEILAAAKDQANFAVMSAYGTSFPDATKRFRSAGWYFSNERAFDLAVAAQLDPGGAISARPEFLEALTSNLNYEGGCNPVNVTYLGGLGWKRQRDIVHQYAQNDRRGLPPSGIPIGNVQAGFQFLHHYEKELGALSYPPDGAQKDPFPFYDRWGDSFNTSAEFVAVNQARSLASLAFLMAETSIKNQPWKAAKAEIIGAPAEASVGQKINCRIKADGIDLRLARIIWEAREHQPVIGESFNFVSNAPGEQWVEVEAQLPDGRRVFAVHEFTCR